MQLDVRAVQVRQLTLGAGRQHGKHPGEQAGVALASVSGISRIPSSVALRQITPRHSRPQDIEQGIEHLKASPIKSTAETNGQLAKLNTPPLNNHTTLYGLLKRYELSYDNLAGFPGWEPQTDTFVKQQIEIETKYEGYIKRQFDAVKKLKEQEKKKIPPEFDYSTVPGLSNELQVKLIRIAPATIGQMERIPGMTEGAISAVLIMMKKQELSGR